MSGWERRRITLPMRLGDVSLAEVSLDAAVMTDHFADISPALLDAFPRSALSDTGTDVAVIHSCPTTGSVPRVSVVSGGIRYVPSTFPRFHTDVTGSFDDYLKQQFRSKTRSTLRRKVKKLAARSGGEVDLREYCTASEVAEWHRIARDVSQTTYQEKLLKRGLPEAPAYVEEIAELARAGRFRGYLLWDEGEPIAYLACPITESGAMLYDHVGHDPRADSHSPGTVLLYLVLQRAFADDSVRVFDFTEGDGDHKQRFATHETPCADVFFFAATPKNLLTVGAHVAVDRSARVSVAMLERLGVKDRLRRALRGRG